MGPTAPIAHESDKRHVGAWIVSACCLLACALVVGGTLRSERGGLPHQVNHSTATKVRMSNRRIGSWGSGARLRGRSCQQLTITHARLEFIVYSDMFLLARDLHLLAGHIVILVSAPPVIAPKPPSSSTAVSCLVSRTMTSPFYKKQRSILLAFYKW